MLRRLSLALLAFLLVLTVFGCASEPSEEPSAEPKADISSEPADTLDLAIIQGNWQVATTLTDIDNEMMRPAADQPGAQWTATVDATAMTLLTDQHEYVGVVSSTSATAWVYEASATYTDEDGATWTSTIVVRATQNGSDAFTGTMEGSIDSDADGHLYTATWEIVAERM